MKVFVIKHKASKHLLSATASDNSAQAVLRFLAMEGNGNFLEQAYVYMQKAGYVLTEADLCDPATGTSNVINPPPKALL